MENWYSQEENKKSKLGKRESTLKNR